MIGSDFERFIRRSSSEHAISAEFLGLPGKGDVPVELTDADGVAGQIHRDNLMIELCVPPQPDGDSFAQAVTRVITAASEWLASRDPDLVITPFSGETFSYSDIHSPAGMDIGCDTDYLVGDLDSVPRAPLNGSALGPRRFAGGHLHFSWSRQEIPAWVGAAICDLIIGLREQRYLDSRRAIYYGYAALHRPTRYPDGSSGVEYRPLDCYWTTTPNHTRRVSKLADAAHKVLTAGSMELIQEMVQKWRELNLGKGLLVKASTPAHCDAVSWADDRFRKEFGYDPV